MPKKPKPESVTPAKVRELLAKAVNDLMAGIESTALSLNIKRPEKDYSLKLTKHQRETLLSHTQISGKLKKKIEEAADGTQVITFTNKELDQLHDEIGSAIIDARSSHKKRLEVVQRQVAEQFNYGLFEEPKPKTPKKPSNPPTNLYQFKITLFDVNPPIWRRIQIEDCTLDRFHEHIQAAMGWMNCHLHMFEVKGERFGPPSPDDEDLGMNFKDESKVLLSSLLPKNGSRFSFGYRYDFGDDWRHEVVFEGWPPVDPKKKYPLCVEGERTCPPEDCGGPWGYVAFLEAITDPEHEEHEVMEEWVGGEFKPEKFSAKDATRAMRDG
jgi:hypothetical protein